METKKAHRWRAGLFQKRESSLKRFSYGIQQLAKVLDEQGKENGECCYLEIIAELLFQILLALKIFFVLFLLMLGLLGGLIALRLLP